MSWLTELARPEIRALKPYQHAAWEPGLTRLHANELPWRTLGDATLAGLNRYPEPHPHALCGALARLYGVASEQLLVCRGSDEAIDLLIRCYCRAGEDAVLICPPTFGMYAVAARVQGASVIEVPLLRARGFGLDVEALRAACSAAVKLVFLCSPNNPTGNRLDTEAILALAHELEGRALLVVDEAYVEFAVGPSLVEQLARRPGLAILRTLSKAHALAGARCGALIAHADVIALLRKIIMPYAVTQLSIEAVSQALTPAALAQSRERLTVIRAERERVAAALQARHGVDRIWPSEANFLLVEFDDAAAVLERTRAGSLLLRDLRGAPGLSEAVRITVGGPEQNDRLLAILS